MSDDLVKRLRSALTYKDLVLCPKAAARIEQLVATNSAEKARADALAEKLERAVEALEEIANDQFADLEGIQQTARATLAQITGGKADE